MNEKIKFGVSSRGLGSLRQANGIDIVCDDYFIVTPADIVSDPSAPDAYVTNLMENVEWVWENDKLVKQEKEIKRMVNKQYKKQINECDLHRLFMEIINKSI